MQENKILAGTWRAGIDVPLFLRKKKKVQKKPIGLAKAACRPRGCENGAIIIINGA